MKVGSLCTGIGGLDLATERHFGASMAWYSEIEPPPCTVLEREWPGVPNLGDFTALDWSQVEPVDIITAGYPCQPFSHAGQRKGTSDARHLWPFVAEAVRVLRPRWVVLENVAGHLTLGFGDVLGDLAEAGFDAEWCVLRASDVGAPHGRARLFVLAHPDEQGPQGAQPAGRRDLSAGGGGAVAYAGGAGTGRDGRAVPRPTTEGRRPGTDVHAAVHAGDDAAADSGRVGRGSRPGLRPVEPGGERRGRPRDDGGPTCWGPPARGAPTDPDGRGLEVRGQLDQWPDEPRLGAPRGNDPDGLGAVVWGTYEPAIRRWEANLGRPAPRPTDDRGRLSPPFVEWMLGYDEGWVAALGRTAALKALGNSVVPQQAIAALSVLAPVLDVPFPVEESA